MAAVETAESSNVQRTSRYYRKERIEAMRAVLAQTKLNKPKPGLPTHQHERGIGPATVLAIGTAHPPTAFEQETYPDFYFDVTGCSENVALKSRFRRICEFLFQSCSFQPPIFVLLSPHEDALGLVS